MASPFACIYACALPWDTTIYLSMCKRRGVVFLAISPNLNSLLSNRYRDNGAAYRTVQWQTGFSAILGTGRRKGVGFPSQPRELQSVADRFSTRRGSSSFSSSLWITGGKNRGRNNAGFGECILLIRAVARATRHSSPRADNRVPCPAFRWFSGEGGRKFSRIAAIRARFHFTLGISFRIWSFGFLPKLIEFSLKFFRPDCVREIYAHRNVMYMYMRLMR